ncbi:splicing factor, suppressor of white-apricot homolog isoform X1 [Gadus morhua]|uniref:SURP motif domain-containing protein n=1 Tax=Gadus morhua TaxID=8049 RepID=A0A8C4Z943_GADMO|nr:splicing factor, suppressor of white-apricot homolog isoform X1 [Gadus morhua]
MYARGKGKKKHNNKAVKDVSDSDKYADLLVFGYACKVFRDDERALFHEHGKHLIPWMGDKKITIDRYDGRGHVHDLSEYDSGSWNTSYQLSEEEARIEALCDEERYLAMHTDLLEEEARQEEEYKRLSEALADEGTYTAVGFKYTADYYDPSQPTEEEEANREAEEAEQDEDEEPFVAPAGLTIPPDVELPATSKTHAIIERTANFVSQQGAQFEIVLKAKQSGNSQFDFLRFDHYLNPYYRHILRAMKEGRYTATADKPEPDPDSSDDSDADGDGSYLHPSLFAPKKNARLAEIMKPLQVMDPDHPLAALVRRAKLESNGGYAIAPTPSEVLEPPPASTPPPAQYSADPTMYYGYYMLPDGTYCLAPPPPPGIEASTYYANTPPGTTAPPTGAEDLLPPGTALPPASDPGPAPHTISAPPALIKNATPGPASAPTPGPTLGPVPAAVVAPPTLVAPPALVQEASTRPPPVSRAATTPVPAPAVIIPPPPDIQPVIDKLAEYVARNGVKFETSVRAKNDPRFDFLQTWNQFNTYYEFKKNYFMQKEGISLAESESAETAEDNEAKEAIVTKAAFAPICFAIRAKDNDMLPLEKNRVRLDDDSDEDKLLEEQCAAVLMARPDLADKEVAGPGATLEEKRPALTPEELEAKQAKLKLEDRLAAAAREKLAQASKESKEKQLQAERKRKAALFLQTLRAPGSGEPEAKRAELDPVTPRQVKPQLSVAACPPPAPTSSSSSSSVAPAYLQDQRAPVEHQGAHRSREGTTTTTTTAATSSSAHSHSYSRSHATSRGAEPERSKGRDKDKKKKKHKKRSRSRSKTRHALPSAYRRTRRSRSRSPGRRDRRAPSAERRHEEREREHHHHHHHHHQHRRGPARSRSPPEKRKSSLRSSGAVPQSASSAFSPSFSPPAAHSPPASPASSLGQSRAASQEKESTVSSSIVSSVQAKITQDLMAKVRAMLAASKTFQPTT